MSYINRDVKETVLKYLKPNKVVVILGARRVGKTQFIQHIISELKETHIFLNGEDIDTHALLKDRSVRNFKKILGKTKLLIIDEVQAIPDIGAKLKLMVDSIDGIKILVSGSSVFDLNNTLGEPLVGRKMTINMYPLAQLEFQALENFAETKLNLNDRLIFGSYPELEHIETHDEKKTYLKEQINSYLLKDILAFEGIRKRETIVSLLRMIAFRIGSEISLESIGNDLQVSKNTVDRYLDLLSKCFVIHKVSGFSRNLDNEITKKSKWYFNDNGIRNALINNFNSLSLRDDHGKLWENYVICERLKFQEIKQKQSLNYFWRTHSNQEIDWVEDRNGKLNAFEFKWKANKKTNAPIAWQKGYPKAKFDVITPENYLDFIV